MSSEPNKTLIVSESQVVFAHRVLLPMASQCHAIGYCGEQEPGLPIQEGKKGGLTLL